MAKPLERRAKTLHGTVRARNISPRGDVEGILLETATGIVQLNLPKHGHAKPLFELGTEVDVIAALDDDGDGDHPVYELDAAGGPAEGTVVRFNYARHGEINGYHLDTGVFVHVKPDGARRYKVKLGDAILAEGESRTGADAIVIEAARVKKRARG